MYEILKMQAMLDDQGANEFRSSLLSVACCDAKID